MWASSFSVMALSVFRSVFFVLHFGDSEMIFEASQLVNTHTVHPDGYDQLTESPGMPCDLHL